MAEEFNIIPEQTGPVNEASGAPEFVRYDDNMSAEEFPDYSAPPASAVTKKKSRKTANAVSFAAMITAAAAVAGGAAALPVAGAANVTASFESVVVEDISLSYYVTVDNPDGHELTLTLENAFYSSSRELDQVAEGVFENLTPDTVYTMSVKGNFGFGDSTVAKKTVKTSSPHPERAYSPGVIGDIVWEYDATGRLLSLSAEADDPHGYLQNFNAYLISADGSYTMIYAFDGLPLRAEAIYCGSYPTGEYTLCIEAVSVHPFYGGIVDSRVQITLY